MAKQNKTQENNASVDDFVAQIENDEKRQDSIEIIEMMTEISGVSAKMWGDSIIGFGKHHYKYASGREGDTIKIGFSPRKANISLYIVESFPEYQDTLKKLGKHKISKACLYIKKLADIDKDVLRTLAELSWQRMTKKYG